MIQRAQSIFYFLTGTAFFLGFVFPFAKSNLNTSKYFEDYLYTIQDHPALLVLTCLGGILALINIFMYKNRPLQLRLGYLLVILAVLLIVTAGTLILTQGTATAAGENITEKFGIALPVIAVITTLLANRGVKKDESIVQSMDRLR